ncbi:hypothetical protein IAE57_00860 [Stenotrophomonas sp. S48]|uniref:hypothetical protein n=1 Tax=Stenotrophomonas TaxID=40323 RepID=UPI0018FFE829|nr:MULTISPECIES: hypothetical protein [Stenotrophomonas]MBK0024702.1 hypothetical protein [Stenotrophomonas sp. S48]MBK0046922.1 hypothetical protein [Stenotrophomonas sp. S49]
MTRENQAVQKSAIPPETDLEGHQWPEAVRFIPYMGDHYWEGIDGQRVLLLGESHYRREGVSDALGVTRPFTQDHFREMALPVRNGRDGPFFKALDLILTGRQDFKLQDAAEAWRRVAFLNISQAFAGSQANHRPRNQALRDGGDVLVRDILPLLRPDVVLVLGRTAWRLFRHGEVAEGLKPFTAKQVNRVESKRRYIESREVWSLDYAGGSALMTWVYHPSWNVDTWQDRAGALRHLISLAEQH